MPCRCLLEELCNIHDLTLADVIRRQLAALQQIHALLECQPPAYVTVQAWESMAVTSPSILRLCYHMRIAIE